MTADKSEWRTAKEGAAYAKENYPTFLARLKDGEVRCVKRGKKYLTTYEWIDNYMLSLEKQ